MQINGKFPEPLTTVTRRTGPAEQPALMPRVKRLKPDEEMEIAVLALASAQRDYTVCFQVNRATGWSLVKDEARRAVTDDTAHPRFTHWDDEHELRYDLVVNKVPGKVLVRSLKRFDYILVVNGYGASHVMDDAQRALTADGRFQAVVRVNDLKPRERTAVTFS